MLPKRYRLKSKLDFAKTYKYGRSIANLYLVLYYFPRSEQTIRLNNPRIGFSVSKKLGSAVVRNKIKRRMRAAIKPYLKFLRKDYDLIFIARKKIKGIPFSDVEKNIKQLLQKSGLLSGSENIYNNIKK